MSDSQITTLGGSTAGEIEGKLGLAARLRRSAVPDKELLDNIGLYLTRQSLSRINLMQQLYEAIVPVHGVIMEFGVRWGQNLALFSMLRGIHEPYNYNRRIVGFDTFQGFPSVHAHDGDAVQEGHYGVAPDWEEELDRILSFHEQNAPIPHKRKYELVKGDAIETVPAYFADHPETIVALAYFDFDLYEPTKVCLEALLPHVTKGTVIAFDELNCAEFPGETIALREVLGLSRYPLRRDPSNPLVSFLVVD